MVLGNSGKRAEEFLRNLSAIWARALKKKKKRIPFIFNDENTG
jgi:hypothetical protein